MRKAALLFSGCFILFFQQAIAQPTVQKLRAQLQQGGAAIADFSINQLMPAQASLLFDTKANIPIAGIKDWLSANLQLRPKTDLLLEEKLPVKYGSFEVQRLQQFYKGIKVEHGIINATGKNGNAAMIQMEFYPVEDGFNTSPVLTEDAARNAAIQYKGAKKYAWQDSGSISPLPVGELVIIADFIHNAKMVLAYKFDIYAIKPLSHAYIYVNASDGAIILEDNLLLHANADGKADTRYSGKQDIVTDLQSGPLLKPYRLRQTRNGYEIRTLNYGNRDKSPDNDKLATDFTDDDNNWTGKEYGDTAAVPNKDDAALDAHFNMQIVSDYWRDVHLRNGWDNNNSNIISYVHVTEDGAILDNAFWGDGAMYYGDGKPGTDPPQTSIDDCGHELGHAICQTTAALVYRWESGAINEGFSDIWAACITNYTLKKFGGIAGTKSVWRLFEETSNPTKARPGLRDMSDPTLFSDPGTYKDKYWKPASFDVCRNPNGGDAGNDNCGVHTNSGVLNKWFYLITNGENGANYFNTPYHVAGIHFGKSDSIAYLTELNLTPNAGYKTVRNVSVNAAITLYGDAAEAQSVRDAWIAVGVDTAVFNMSNTGAFTTNSFSTIAIGKAGCIWAGTTTGANNSSNGLYRYNGKKWEQANVLLNNAIQGMTVDKAGGIWIAQSGRTGAQANSGGINYFADSAFSSNVQYSISDGLVSRNSRSIFVDTSRTNLSDRPVVWTASLAQITAGVSGTGGVCTGLNTYIPVIQNYFTKQKHGIDEGGGSGGAQTIGGNGKEVWAFASNNFGKSQLIKYDADTKDSIGREDFTINSLLPSNFQAKSIYFDFNDNKWIGLQQNGLVVQDKAGIWFKIDTVTFKSILPYGTIINNNAIAGDKMGNVYIGTTNGLVYYNRGPLDKVSSFRRFTTVHGLPSNNVRAIAIDTIRYKLLLATDNGILFFDQQCQGEDNCWEQVPNRKSASTSLSGGNWSDPSIWSTNTVPDQYTDVIISYPVAVDIEGICATLKLTTPGALNVLAGKKLTISDLQRTINQTSSLKKY